MPDLHFGRRGSATPETVCDGLGQDGVEQLGYSCNTLAPGTKVAVFIFACAPAHHLDKLTAVSAVIRHHETVKFSCLE